MVSEPSAALSLFDPAALGIVMAGTALATLARAGWRDSLLAVKSALALAHSGFCEAANRSALARLARTAQGCGIRAIEAPLPPDPALALAVSTLARTASTRAMRDSFADAQAERELRAGRAASVFDLGGETAPVFGLVGTLFALTQFAPVTGEGGTAATLGAIATAVLSSLYGVLLAHGLCLPLAAAIARRSEREEAARSRLIEWFTREIEPKPTAFKRVA